ncbi:MAG: DUF362 domain-containing protein [Clostridia bacterium]|nr:DUF362 domain-containing protein [Clostridia bacterium]
MIALQSCDNYEYDTVREKVKAVFDTFGGIEKFVQPGAKVVIKPNLIGRKKPEEAATTHPSLVRATAELCVQAGGNVMIAESPGGVYDKAALKSIYRATGIEEAAMAAGAALNFDTSVTKVKNPDGKYLKTVEIITPLADADVVIDLAKLKTHGMMVYTGAVKNMFGAIAGVDKAEYHMKMPDYDSFADTVIDIFLSTKVSFCIIDAVTGMHKDGPTAGDPIDMGLLIGSDNAFEADRAALDIIGAAIDRVPMARTALARGLMQQEIGETDVRGDIDLAEARRRASGFVVKYNDSNSRLHFSDGLLGRALEKLMKPRPVFTKLCRSCGECARHCPVKAITVEKGKRAKADLDKCIRCYCCQELCPFKAVKIRKTVAATIAQRL